MPAASHTDAVRRRGLAAHDDLCAALRGQERPLSTAAVNLARRDRIHLVVADTAAGCIADETERVRLFGELRAAAVIELFRERELRRLLGGLADAGIAALLLKGAGLAYTVYRAPHLRPRTDVDILIARDDLAAAERAILAGGGRRIAEQSHESVTTQRHYVLQDAAPAVEHLDLHWNVAVPHVFRDALTFSELAARATAIDALGPHARTLSLPDALFLACIHLTAHHHDAPDLVWLWDIHLLAPLLTEDQQRLFADLAAARAMRAVCTRALRETWTRFATPGAAGLMARLRPSSGEPEEPSARFLKGSMRQVDVLRGDLSAAGWLGGLQLLGAHLFPSRIYMRSIYPRWPELALPLAYIHRAVRGAPGWFRRPIE